MIGHHQIDNLRDSKYYWCNWRISPYLLVVSIILALYHSALADLIPRYDHKAGHNQWLRVYWYIFLLQLSKTYSHPFLLSLSIWFQELHCSRNIVFFHTPFYTFLFPFSFTMCFEETHSEKHFVLLRTLSQSKLLEISDYLNEIIVMQILLGQIDILQVRSKFETSTVSCSKFIKNKVRKVWTANILHSRAVTDTCIKLSYILHVREKSVLPGSIG